MLIYIRACINILFLSMDDSNVYVYILYPFISWWTFGLLVPFGYYGAMNICVQLFQYPFSVLLGSYIGAELLSPPEQRITWPQMSVRLKSSGLWFHQMFKIFNHYLLHFFFLSSLSHSFSLWNSNYIYICSVFLCSVLHFYVAFPASSCSLICSYTMSNWLLSLSNVFFIHILILISRRFIWVFLYLLYLSPLCSCFLYFLEYIDYIYNCCFSSLSFLCLLSLTGFSPAYGYFPSTFACLKFSTGGNFF